MWMSNVSVLSFYSTDWAQIVSDRGKTNSNIHIIDSGEECWAVLYSMVSCGNHTCHCCIQQAKQSGLAVSVSTNKSNWRKMETIIWFKAFNISFETIRWFRKQETRKFAVFIIKLAKTGQILSKSNTAFTPGINMLVVIVILSFYRLYNQLLYLILIISGGGYVCRCCVTVCVLYLHNKNFL